MLILQRYAWGLLWLCACVPPSKPLPGEPEPRCEVAPCVTLCGGQPCPSSCVDCLPETVATFPDAVNPSGLAIAGEEAFVCDDMLIASIHRVSLLDGKISSISSIDGACPGVAFDPVQDRILWFINKAQHGQQPLGIWSQPRGSITATLETTTHWPVAVDTRLGETLWTGKNGLTSGLFVVRQGLSIPVSGMTGTTTPGTLTVGPDGRIFVAWPEVRNISMALDPDGNEVRLLVDGKRTERDPLDPLAMAANKAFLYYGMAGGLWRVPVDGSAPAELLLEGQERIVGLAVDEESVAWLEAAQGALLRLDLASNRVELLAGGLLQPRDLHQDTNAYYWLEPPRRTLVRIPKKSP